MLRTVGSVYRKKRLLGILRGFSVRSNLLKYIRPQNSGCFGLAGLYDPEDWETIASSCISDCFRLAEKIRVHSKSPSPEVLMQFDDLSDRLCRVLDVAELCRNVHPDPEFVEASNQAYMQVSTIIQNLNADSSIYEPLKILHEQYQSTSKSQVESRRVLSDEDAIMVKSLKEDFERGGINRKRSEKDRLIHLQQQINVLGSEFMSTSSGAPPSLVLHVSKVRGLPIDERLQLKPLKKNSNYVEIPLNSAKAKFLLKWASDAEVRKEVYKLLYDAGNSKMKILDSILEKRHEIANVLGFASYANMVFSDRLASSPTDVLDFLTKFSKLLDGSAMSERLSLEQAKKLAEPRSGTPDLHGWDRGHYIGRIKAQKFNLSSSDISSYFPLKTCLTVLSDIVKHVFGIRMLHVHGEPYELWHPDVEKLLIIDERGDTLGYIFLDLYPREGKYPHAAHFAIRCGRQLDEKCDYQTPVVALVCNFGLHQESGQRLLTISEYETLFHEFGHSLHSILSRTRYQHLSGTRVATDLVEVPSHIFEHFAWDPRIISRYARHYRTGDPMPMRTVKSLCASRHGFAATDMQMQILFSAMDLHFHGENPPIGATTKTFAELQKQLTAMDPDDDISVPSSFHHFVGYGAGYYSYIFARILSAQIWDELFEDDPFSREGGNRLRYGFLAFGGSKEPSLLMKNLVSKEITCESILKRMGTHAKCDSSQLHVPIK